MVKFEKILGLIVIVALTLKFFLIPGGGILLTFSLMSLACIFYLFGFAFFNQIELSRIFQKNSYQGISGLRIWGAIGTGIGLSQICIGILFTLQHWPGANITLITGLIVTLIVFVIALIRFFKSKNNYYKFIFKRIVIIGGFGLLLILLPELTIVKIQFRNHPNYIKTYEEYLKDPQNDELQEKLGVEYLKTTMSEEEYEYYINQGKKGDEDKETNEADR